MITDTIERPPLTYGQQSAGAAFEDNRIQYGQRTLKTETLSLYKPSNNPSLKKNRTLDSGIEPGTY